MRRSLASLCLVLLGAGCPAEEPIISFSEYRASFNQVVAEYFKRCGLLDPSRENQLKTMRLLAVPPELERVIDEEIMIGRARLKPDCFAPLRDATCDINEAFATIEGCLTGGRQYIPQVRAGLLCRLQGECIDGFCDLGAVRKPCGSGVCSPYLRTGTQCGVGKGQCDPERDSCWQPDPMKSGVCRPRGGPGIDCLSDADCNPESYCRTDRASGQRRCAARQKNLATGAACDGGQVPDGCKPGDRCTESEPGRGDFACRTGRGEGGACYTPLDCAGGLVCAGANVEMKRQGQCRRQGRIGESCRESGAVCQLTLYCSSDGTCKPAGATGESCEDVIGGQECLSGLCSAMPMLRGTCIEPRADGSRCMTSAECRSGSCDRNGFCSSVCAPLR